MADAVASCGKLVSRAEKNGVLQSLGKDYNKDLVPYFLLLHLSHRLQQSDLVHCCQLESPLLGGFRASWHISREHLFLGSGNYRVTGVVDCAWMMSVWVIVPACVPVVQQGTEQSDLLSRTKA